eukprot:PITA_05341
MLATRIIEPVNEFDWVSPMVVQEKKKKGEIHICMDLRKLNDAYVNDPFPMPFTDEVMENIVLNLKKCMFLIPFGNLLSHVVCKQILMVDPVKIVVILNMQAPCSVKQLHAMLGHTGYYRKFIEIYAQVTTPMEHFLKKDATYYLNEECDKSLEMLKEKMAATPILVFLKWDVKFHVHVDASCIALGVVLTK